MAIRAFLVGAAVLGLVSTAGAVPGNGKLAYVREGKVFVAAVDGSGETKIADASTVDLYGRALWSPDGAHVAYITDVRRPGFIDLVPAVATEDGSSHTVLATQGAFTLACWLDADTLVAVNAEEVSTNPATLAYDLYAFGLDGTRKRLTTDGATKYVSDQGCAPDGSAVAYTKQLPDSTSVAVVVSRDGSTSTVLTPSGLSDREVAWSPEGSRLEFLRAGRDPGLYVSDRAGGGAKRVTTLANSGIARWSPDASELLFMRTTVDSSRCDKFGCAATVDVWTVGADGSNPRLLVSGGYDTSAGGWSPDGRRITFTRGYRGLITNADGSCKTVLPANVPPSFAWQPVPGKLPAAPLACADLKLSTGQTQLDLPLDAVATYTLTVLNQGNEAASAVKLDQPADDSVTFTAVEPSQGTCSSADGIHCSLGMLPTGATATVRVTFTVGNDAATSILHPTVSAPEPDGDPFENTASVYVTVFDCTILGTFGVDTLNGTPGRDKICGRFGDDRIYGNAGNDVIHGGEGADVIYGGKGRDQIYGGGGEDVVLARDGMRDIIDCGPEKDVAVVDRIDVVSHCRTVYRPHRATLKRRHTRAPR